MLAIRPPEFFPDLAYAALLLTADRFVLADTFQYSRQSLQNRTKVRNPQGWHWVSVPLKGRQHGRAICDVRIRQVQAWRKRHWKAFMYNYRATPFFDHYEARLRRLFEQPWTHLGALTCTTVTFVHDVLGAGTPLIRASALAGRPDTLPALWARMGTATLLIPEYVARHDAQVAPEVYTLHYAHPRYRQAFDGFEPGMTALDMVFNYGPEAGARIREGVRLEEATPVR